MQQSDFVTYMRVQLWTTDNQQLTALAPTFTFEGTLVDMEATVRLAANTEDMEFTLWNVADPRVNRRVFRKGYLVAIDMARISLNQIGGAIPYMRVGFGPIKTRKLITSETDTDVGYRVTATPTSETTQEIQVKQDFPADKGPYRLKAIISELLRVSGIAYYNILLQEDYLVPNFTADGTLFSEMRKAAGKAGVAIGVWPQGANLLVSDRYVLGRTLDDGYVLNVEEDDSATVQAALPAPTPDIQQAGEAQDLSQQYGTDTTDENAQVALDAQAQDVFVVELALAPEITKGSILGLSGPHTLSRMGYEATRVQFFNVIGIEHRGSSVQDSPMDTTRATISLRSVQP